MSKSVGNIVTLREVLDTYGRDAILVLFAGAHYRSRAQYSDDAMEDARKVGADFRTAFRWPPSGPHPAGTRLQPRSTRTSTSGGARCCTNGERPGRWTSSNGVSQSLASSSRLPSRRLRRFVVWQASDRRREAGDFETADRLRDEIDRLGWEVQDVPNGYRLVRKP